jgi:DNA-binding SARP family transcriptional activator/tetratricopeptide (TPR) repeat protein
MVEIRLLNEQLVVGVVETGVRPPSSRSSALAAFLILHAGVPQMRGRIAEMFWPDSPEAQARTNLRRELHNLRLALADDPSLVVEPTTLTWSDTGSCRVDVRIFEMERRAALVALGAGEIAPFMAHAELALAEYRGDLMPGSYEDWVLEHREVLARACVALCDEYVRECRSTGDPARALPVARRRVQLQPLEETGYRILMELQADDGDRAAAVSTYHRCADLLERELGVSPDHETTAMVERLLDRDAEVRSGPPASPRARRATGAGCVGRELEIEQLTHLWHQAGTGAIPLAVLSGEPGVGKSRVVAELASIARGEGAVVATARCFGQSGHLALAPVVDWLRHPDVAAGVTGLDPLWRTELDRLMPRVGPAIDVTVHPGSAPPEVAEGWQRHRFFEALTRAILSPGRRTLLVLDDLQWCDQETMTWLAFLIRLAFGEPVLIATTVRPDELAENEPVASGLRALRSVGVVHDVALGPLDPAGTGALAAALLGWPLTPTDESLLHAASGGYPLFVVEAVRTLDEHRDTDHRDTDRADTDRADTDQGDTDRGDTDRSDGGSGAGSIAATDLQGVLQRRLADSSTDAQQIGSLAAAIGRNFDLELLCQASELDPHRVVQAVDELWRRRILREQRGGYDFTHDLLRDAAYASVSPPHRWLLHRRIADAMELLHAGHLDAVAAELAEQYERGGRAARAIEYFRRAAQAATAVFAHADAVRSYRRSLQLIGQLPASVERDTLELDVLEAMSAPLNACEGYSSPHLQATLERAVDLAQRLDRARSESQSLVGLFAVRFVQGHSAEAHRLASRALALAEGDDQLSGTAHFAFAGAALSLGQLEVAVSHFELAGDLSGSGASLLVGTRPEVHSQAWAAHAHWLLGNEEQALAHCRGAIERARSLDHPYSLAVALAYAAITHQFRQDRAALSPAVDELGTLCERYDFAYYAEWSLVLDGWASGGERGVGQIRRGIEQLRAHGAYARMSYWLCLLADTYLANGRRDQARPVLDAATAAALQRDDRWWLPEVLRLRAAVDETPSAFDLLERAIEEAAAQSSHTLEARCRADLAALASVRTRPGDPAAPPNAVRTPPS